MLNYSVCSKIIIEKSLFYHIFRHFSDATSITFKLYCDLIFQGMSQKMEFYWITTMLTIKGNKTKKQQ